MRKLMGFVLALLVLAALSFAADEDYRAAQLRGSERAWSVAQFGAGQ